MANSQEPKKMSSLDLGVTLFIAGLLFIGSIAWVLTHPTQAALGIMGVAFSSGFAYSRIRHYRDENKQC